MKRFLTLIFVMVLVGLSLFSCSGDEDEAPEGLQMIENNAEGGFKLYGPEGWSIVSSAYNTERRVYAARLTGTSKTSLTFVESDMPEGDLTEYFNESLSALPEAVRSTLTVTKSAEPCTFGNADDAYKFIYTYKYSDFDYDLGDYAPTDFTCMQILIKNDGSFYIFTYTAYGTPESEDEENDYTQYLELIQLSIDSFEFYAPTEGEESAPEYEKDGDGYNLVSDKAICGFELYLPDDYEVAEASGDVEAKISDGATLSLTRATDTGVAINTYWELRKENLAKIVTNITEIRVNVINNGENEEKVVLGDLAENRVALYEYTYEYNGKTYHVYQIMGVDLTNGYVFTYTAEESEYAAHLETIKKILEKVRF